MGSQQHCRDCEKTNADGHLKCFQLVPTDQLKPLSSLSPLLAAEKATNFWIMVVLVQVVGEGDAK